MGGIIVARDDYHVITYRILIYLYACLKQGQKPNFDYLKYNTDDFPVGKDYWYYIIENLYKDGYIEGVVIIPVLGQVNKGVKLNECLKITPKGIEYLQDNSTMQKAKNYLKELKEIIPGL